MVLTDFRTLKEKKNNISKTLKDNICLLLSYNLNLYICSVHSVRFHYSFLKGNLIYSSPKTLNNIPLKFSLLPDIC